MVHEWEIKISVGDFKQDFKKYKHLYYGRTLELQTSMPIEKYRKLFPNYKSKWFPNYFSYVVPQGLIDIDHPMFPRYAGLYWVTKHGKFIVRKKPVQLHKKNNVNQKLTTKVAQSLCHRYVLNNAD